MNEFIIPDDIQNLNIEKIKSNLFHYKYSSKSIKKLMKTTHSKEELEDFSIYNSFKGEIYENIIYELLLLYANLNTDITKFILKGPHQFNNNLFFKHGLMIDKSSQIVYKSAYKDISEFDAMFFTKTSLVFVEMSTSKKTASLNKRLAKKYALLTILFPHFEIKALIILTKGSVGLRSFPSYATIWLSCDFTDHELLEEIVFSKYKQEALKQVKDKKYIQTNDISYTRFSYFQNLEYILQQTRKHKLHKIDINFLQSSINKLYFDIYTKLYIGYICSEDFLLLLPSFNEKIFKIFVSIEKINKGSYDLVYYAKLENNKLKRIHIQKDSIKIKDKDMDGFTNAEVRFLKFIMDENFLINIKDINLIKKLLKKW